MVFLGCGLIWCAVRGVGGFVELWVVGYLAGLDSCGVGIIYCFAICGGFWGSWYMGLDLRYFWLVGVGLLVDVWLLGYCLDLPGFLLSCGLV